MTNQEQKAVDDESEKIWRVAETARQLAMRSALKDKTIWGNQLLNLACGVVKAVALTVGFSIFLASVGLPESFCMFLALVFVGPFAAFNRSSFFWRNLFAEHADSAFDYALKNYDSRINK